MKLLLRFIVYIYNDLSIFLRVYVNINIYLKGPNISLIHNKIGKLEL